MTLAEAPGRSSVDTTQQAIVDAVDDHIGRMPTAEAVEWLEALAEAVDHRIERRTDDPDIDELGDPEPTAEDLTAIEEDSWADAVDFLEREGSEVVVDHGGAGPGIKLTNATEQEGI